MNFKTKNLSGFTLIELLVVITVIGILATLIVANFASARSRARDVRRKSDLNNIKKALRLYYNDYQSYPSASGGRIAGCGGAGTAACLWGGSFATTGSNGTTYMQYLPEDPLNTGTNVYVYSQDAGGDGFQLTAYLENASDEDSAASQTRCGISIQANRYVVCED